jgi:four helix bundle protein
LIGEVVATEGPKKVTHYKELLVWQKAMVLAKEIYKTTALFPGEERFGLTSQMRRSAVSVPSNIAEGQARQGTREFLQFLSHASGSLAELDTQILLSLELGYARDERAEALQDKVTELQKMMSGLRRSLGGTSSH